MPNRLLHELQVRRRGLAIVVYAVITAASYAAAYGLRFEFAVPREYLTVFARTAVPLVLIRLVSFLAFRLSRERWRYVGVNDVVRLAGAVAVGSIAYLILADVVLSVAPRTPHSVMVIEALLTCMFTAGAWISYRVSVERFRRNGSRTRARRALIIGAGDVGNLLAHEMLKGTGSYFPVGFIDDSPRMRGASVQGLPVLGTTADLTRVSREVHAQELIIAIPSATPSDLRRIVAASEETLLPVKVLPGIGSVLAGNVSLNQLRNVQIEDLLGREPIQLDLPELAADLRERCVLITGAAGSIGSELARQIARHHPSRLLLLDRSETDLFYLDLELRGTCPDVAIVPIIGDVGDDRLLDRVFQLERPERVFHAAAYKHVPLMEVHVREAILNNVLGTLRVAEAAGRFHTDKFVLVSTDKAVRPTSVMGGTKRVAELIIGDLQELFPQTSYCAVRFGNVLGSRGSVIPIFQRQITEGKPLTVTHPEVTRYFMTIAEAVQLVLQASVLGELRGKIAMLEMGDPVRISDLAANLLRLSGIPATSERIVYTGLRRGEKLHEELSAPEEDSIPTAVPKVHVLQRERSATPIVNRIERWEEALEKGLDGVVLSEFRSMFPTLELSGLNSLIQNPANPGRELQHTVTAAVP